MTSVLVTLSNEAQWERARKTIRQAISIGNWTHDVVFIAVDFEPPPEPGVRIVHFPRIDTSTLVAKIGARGFKGGDGRELTKLIQWEKLHVFDDFFKQWGRVVYLDAGIRICGDMSPLLNLSGDFLAPYDGQFFSPNSFKCQLETENPAYPAFIKTFGANILNHTYFLNCMWMYNTSCLDIFTKADLIEVMNKYPIFHCNEMDAMNAVIHFRHRLWEPFPRRAAGRILFEWSEINQDYPTTWEDYYFLKYSVTGAPPPDPGVKVE